MMDVNEGSVSADHLCVLVHGLWGNPNHMNQVAKAMREVYPEEKLHILIAKRNSGNFTYDGIELGGERVCVEIEEELESIREKGGKITKLSIVGYSLGGLVARYAVGLLYAKGLLDQIEPVNFTTFATPHLGVRMPLRGWVDNVFNVLGARLLSESGRQLFIVDKFRDTGRPLLSVMTEPRSIFVTGLRKFKRRTLYGNVANDRSVNLFTSMMSKTDPYVDMSKIEVHGVEGYENVVLDRMNPFSPKPTSSQLAAGPLSYVRNVPFVLAVALILPIGVTAFVLNSVFQTIRSTRRIRQHESGLAGIEIAKYRMPIWINELRETVEDAYEALNSSQKQSYLPESEEEEEEEILDSEEANGTDVERRHSHPHIPTLALAPSQFKMIEEMDKLGWRKYPVWIQKVRHSHAAIIVRSESKSFSEGYLVLKHWLREEFIV
ncbi:DUF676-domain-containing protein [Xylariaceae sp. FL0594]|nr:DUF676-domain-containing protein [Xylariaceae sp. FL0594]